MLKKNQTLEIKIAERRRVLFRLHDGGMDSLIVLLFERKRNKLAAPAFKGISLESTNYGKPLGQLGFLMGADVLGCVTCGKSTWFCQLTVMSVSITAIPHQDNFGWGSSLEIVSFSHKIQMLGPCRPWTAPEVKTGHHIGCNGVKWLTAYPGHWSSQLLPSLFSWHWPTATLISPHRVLSHQN